eukprot:2677755-Pyramimonas_sp.AAC.1
MLDLTVSGVNATIAIQGQSSQGLVSRFDDIHAQQWVSQARLLAGENSALVQDAHGLAILGFDRGNWNYDSHPCMPARGRFVLVAIFLLRTVRFSCRCAELVVLSRDSGVRTSPGLIRKGSAG